MGLHTGDEANLRVSDDERNHVVGLLQVAVGRGLLDLDEFTRRADTALAATVRADLNRVLLDLPGLVHHNDSASPGELVELHESGTGAIRRHGAWTVPEKLVLWPRVRTAEIDFTSARIDHPQVRIILHGGSPHVRLRLPHGATADISDLRTPRGKPARVRDRAAFIGAGGTPHFVLTGRTRDSMVVLLP